MTTLEKRLILTTETNGHAHVISTGDRMHGITEPDPTDGHYHDWVRDDTGTVLIAPTNGHFHGIKHIMTKDGKVPPEVEAQMAATEDLTKEKEAKAKKPKKGEPGYKDEDGEEQPMTKFFECEVAKVDTDLGLVFGYAVICTKNGEPHFDLQNEHVPDTVMLDFSTDFMRNSRVAKAMHDGDQIGDVVFAFPMTSEIAKSLNIKVEQTGLIIGMAPGAEGLKKFEDGTFTGFSIGGYAIYADAEDAE